MRRQYASGPRRRDPRIAMTVEQPPLGGLFPICLEAMVPYSRPVPPEWIDICLIRHFVWKHPHLLRNFDYIGMHHYSLTWCCEVREPVFTQPDRVDLVRTQILRACRESEFEVIADCFMPDQVHKLVRGRTPTADGQKFIRLAKQYSGFYFKQAFNRRLWQHYGHDRFVRNDGDIKSIVQYIIENPVRAGLVTRPGDYPFTGSHIYTLDQLIDWAYS